MEQIVPTMVPACTFPCLRWLIGGFFFPLVMPWLLYKVIITWTYKTRQRAKLENKVVLITGASSGLGEALATEFYNAGCKVILASRRLEELEKVKSKLLNITVEDGILKHSPAVIQLDLEDLNNIPAKAKEALEIHGRIDILVNNAGISYRGDILNTSIDVDMKVMAVNYFGQVALTKAVLPSMIANKSGHIIAIGSIQGKIAMPFRSAYTASKHAIQAFSDSLRSELCKYNIPVTMVNPGYIKTNLSRNAITGDGSQYGIVDKTTTAGMDATVVAKMILRAIVFEQHEILLSDAIPSLAVYLRLLCPSTYFAVMKSRALKQIGYSIKEKES